MAKKYSRRPSRKHRAHKRTHRHRGHKQRGGNSTPASTNDTSMKAMMNQNLAQGQQFASMHANQHGGGGLDAGPFPGAVTEQSVLPANLAAAARVAPLNAALNAIANMKDPGQAGGGMKGGNIPCEDWETHGYSSKADCIEGQKGGGMWCPSPCTNYCSGMCDDDCKCTKDGGARKGRKGRKASKKSRKGRKGRKGRRGTRRQRGGAAYDSNPAPFGGPSMLLDGSQMSKALSGMNAEWKLAENPDAFAPGVRA